MTAGGDSRGTHGTCAVCLGRRGSAVTHTSAWAMHETKAGRLKEEWERLSCMYRHAGITPWLCRHARLHAAAQCLAGAAPISLRSCSRVTNIAIFQEPRRRKLRRRVGGKGTTARQVSNLHTKADCNASRPDAMHCLASAVHHSAAVKPPAHVDGNTRQPRQPGSLGTKPAPERPRALPPERLHHHISHALVAALLAQGWGAGGRAGWQALLRSRRG